MIAERSISKGSTVGGQNVSPLIQLRKYDAVQDDQLWKGVTTQLNAAVDSGLSCLWRARVRRWDEAQREQQSVLVAGVDVKVLIYEAEGRKRKAREEMEELKPRVDAARRFAQELEYENAVAVSMVDWRLFAYSETPILFVPMVSEESWSDTGQELPPSKRRRIF